MPKKLLRFALPLLLANILQAFYNVVDLLVVGRFVGDLGLVAISNASKLCYLINSVCLGLTTGGSVLIAQYKGAGDKTGQAAAFQTLALLSFVAAAFVTAGSLVIYRPLFRLLQVPAEAYQQTCEYMKIICCGTVFVFGYHTVCAACKGLADSRSPLCFVAIATVVNVLLDLLLVGPCGLGTAGAAYATVTAQASAFVLSLCHLRRRGLSFFAARGRHNAFSWEKLAAMVKIGLPTAIQMTVVNASYLLVTGMLNPFGSAVAAAFGVGLQINTFAGMPCWAMGQAVTTMVGQCLGAGQTTRARQVVKTGLAINLVGTVVIVLVVQLFAGQLIALFGSATPAVVREGVRYLRICCSVSSLVYVLMYTLDSFAIGAGAAHVAMCNALMDAGIVRLPACWLLAFVLDLGASGIYYGQALSPVLPALSGLLFFWNDKNRPAGRGGCQKNKPLDVQ